MPVLELVRKRKNWKCSECGHVQDNTQQCAKCHAPSWVFDEVPLPPVEGDRKVYEIVSNIHYQGQFVGKGTKVSLVKDDWLTKDLLKRKLIKPSQAPKERKKRKTKK